MPEQTEEQALNPNTGKNFQEVYDFHRLMKVKKDKDRGRKIDSKIDRHKKTAERALRKRRKGFSIGGTVK